MIWRRRAKGDKEVRQLRRDYYYREERRSREKSSHKALDNIIETNRSASAGCLAQVSDICGAVVENSC